MKLIAKNKRARFDYEILKIFEAGMVLLGTEIKSIRDHRVSLVGSFISVRDGEAWWKGGTIAPWECAGKTSHTEQRDRKLLLKKSEIKTLEKALNEKGHTVVPLALGLVRGKAKIEIALAKGKKQYDKRETIKQRDIDRAEKTIRKY
ncbi:MAG: SsrA-binding protein SmpB [Candidatus Peregrinibacteria bacterium]